MTACATHAYQSPSGRHFPTMTNRERDDAKRVWVSSIKRDKGCFDCGYNQNAFALEFDHLPGTKGKKTVASMMSASRTVILAEIVKCQVVCANCHAIRTMTRLSQRRPR